MQLHGCGPQRHGKEAAIDEPGVDQPARPAQRCLGFARAGLTLQQHDRAALIWQRQGIHGGLSGSWREWKLPGECRERPRWRRRDETDRP
jgi:hypothetical protein